MRFLFVVHKNEEKAEQNSVLFHRLTLKERGLRPNGYFPLMRQPLYSGRDDWIRTSGLCVPNATLYQAEPHPGVCNQICVSIADLYIVALIADFFKNFIRENENIFVLAAAAR